MKCPHCSKEYNIRRDPLNIFFDTLKIILIGIGGFIVIQGLIKFFA